MLDLDAPGLNAVKHARRIFWTKWGLNAPSKQNRRFCCVFYRGKTRRHRELHTRGMHFFAIIIICNSHSDDTLKPYYIKGYYVFLTNISSITYKYRDRMVLFMSKKAVCTKAMSHKPSSRVDPLRAGRLRLGTHFPTVEDAAKSAI